MAEAIQSNYKGGYSKAYFLVNSIFNISFSILLGILATPFLVVIALLIKVLDGGPVLYKGIRLGIHKSPFTMYKFRTLTPGAQRIIGAELLTEQIASDINVLTPFGTFLRETRLDELPQLFNIMKGDMDFLGPRPERPEIYEKFCRQIRGYDKRFMVKPGLIGYSQLFTPHSSPKRIRTLIDNKFLQKKQKLLWDMFFIFLTICMVLNRIVRFGSKIVRNKIASVLHGSNGDKRKMARVSVEQASVFIRYANGKDDEMPIEGKIVNLNEDALLIHSQSDLKHEDLLLQMEITIPSLHGRINRKKIALASGTIYKNIRTLRGLLPYTHIIRYTPFSPLNGYMIHQYFLDKSII